MIIYAPPSVFYLEGDLTLEVSLPSSSALRESPPSGVAPSSSIPRETLPSGGSPLRLSLRRLYPSILPVSSSVQHPIYQSSREGKNALT